jgi:small subunit ribosomal protein S15
MEKQQKQALINDFKTNEKDNGSTQVQIALITERINELNRHFDRFSKDYASRVGLLKLVARRKKLLKYLAAHDKKEYLKIVSHFGFRE